MREMAYVALGSNLGDRAAYLAAARTALSLLPQSELAAASAVEETPPLGDRAQPPYLNQMVALETSLSPRQLLERLHAIEASLGRVRGERWAPRTMDLDIVQFGALELLSPELTLPHPGIADRAFWQRESAELDALVGAVR